MRICSSLAVYESDFKNATCIDYVHCQQGGAFPQSAQLSFPFATTKSQTLQGGILVRKVISQVVEVLSKWWSNFNELDFQVLNPRRQIQSAQLFDKIL